VQVFLGNIASLDNWLELSKRLFDSALETGGMWHMYGHSHEIEQLGLWHELEEILDYVGNREQVTYIPNGDLISLLAASPAGSQS